MQKVMYFWFFNMLLGPMPVVSDQICNFERPVLAAQSPKNGEIFALAPVFAQYLLKYASYRKSYSILF